MEQSKAIVASHLERRTASRAEFLVPGGLGELREVACGACARQPDAKSKLRTPPHLRCRYLTKLTYPVSLCLPGQLDQVKPG